MSKKYLSLYFLSLFISTTFSLKNPFDSNIIIDKIEESKLAAGECKDLTVLAKKENIKIIGRYYQNLDITWLIQSGSAIEFKITANSATLELRGDNGSMQAPDRQPRYGIYIDDKLFADKFVSQKEFQIELFKGTTQKEAKVKIMLLTEAMYGGIGLAGITINSCAEKPVIPTEKKKASIEFIGDSITCAYGVEANSKEEHFTTTTQNWSKSYAYLTAQALDVDYSTCIYSGHGIVSGYSGGDKNADGIIPPLYSKVSSYYEYKYEWNFESHPHDLIVINLGTNDNNYVTREPNTRNNEFIEGYVKFLTQVREKNPESYIICTLGTLGCEKIYELVEQAVKKFGDQKVSCYLSAAQDMNTDGIGADWHPSPKTHEKSAKVLVEKIKKILGFL